MINAKANELKLTNPLSNFFLSQIVNDGIMLEIRKLLSKDTKLVQASYKHT
jgi:hypothetical protein